MDYTIKGTRGASTIVQTTTKLDKAKVRLVELHKQGWAVKLYVGGTNEEYDINRLFTSSICNV